MSDVVETDDLFRLYRPGWVIMFSEIDRADLSSEEACRAFFAATYEGRVRDEDWRVDVTESVARLWLRLPVLRGEFKYADHAQRFADEQGYTDATIVPRNSKADHDLRSYGMKLLPA